MKRKEKIMSKLRKIVLFFCAICFCGLAFSETITVDWLNTDGTVGQTTTCETGDDLILPPTPIKPGYTFTGWVAYTPIEYIESTGTQYIDTGVVADETTEAEIQFSDASSGIPLFLTSATYKYGWQQKNFGVIFNSNPANIFFYMNCDGQTTTANPISGNIKLLLTGIYLNDEPLSFTKGSIPSSSSFSTTYPIVLFARNAEGSVMGMSSFKLYFFKLWQNGIIVRDFIPVLNPNGTPCLFDKVSNQFFYNAGSGDFTAGPVVSE